jgi:SAM-dependent methyltransferase
MTKKLRTELEYIRLVRPTAFARAAVLDARDAVLRRRDPLTPPRRLGFVGGGDFRTAGEAFRQLFVDVGGLRPEDDVLDVGSGVGRGAIGLTGWLQGRYEGIDVVRRGIEWCQQAITPRYPNFHFQVADVYNRHYNPVGRFSASEYRFPFEDRSFDFVVLTSVFTSRRSSSSTTRPGGASKTARAHWTSASAGRDTAPRTNGFPKLLWRTRR